jgi:hypothetical protein
MSEKAEKIRKSRMDRRKAEKSSKSRIFLLKAEEVATLFSTLYTSTLPFRSCFTK